MKTRYAGYDVLAKWQSPSFDAVTRTVVAARLDSVPQRRFFTAAEWRLMDAIAARLVPQPDRAEPIPITPSIDAQLFENRGEGFRYADAPPLQAAWRDGLRALDGEARRAHARSFVELDDQARDATLGAVQRGDVDPALWGRVQPQRFFRDVLLKTVAAVYYSHPAAWSEIGFGGPASPRGYVRLGFDARDPWEAVERR